MPTIDRLSTIDNVTGSDQVPLYDASNGQARKASMSQVLAYFQSTFASPEFDVQTAVPVNGFTLTLEASTKSIWLLLSPAGTLATGTIVLPPVAGCFDGQEVLVTSTAIIGLLTVNGNGAIVSAGPDSIAAGGSFVLRYRALTTTWYVVAKSIGNRVEAGSIVCTGTINGPFVEVDEVSADSVFAATSLGQFPGTVAALGSAANAGVRKFVTDANATTFGSIVAGGGSNAVPVYSDGTNWRIG
jgi:hypothetical protein